MEGTQANGLGGHLLRPIRGTYRIVRKAIYPNYRRNPSGILCESYKFIYVPIPKVANSSIKRWVAGLLGLSDLVTGPPGLLQYASSYPWARSIGSSQYREYFKFTFVRNPFDRLVSCYHQKIKADCRTNEWYEDGVARTFIHKGDGFHGSMTFKDFVFRVAEIPDEVADRHIRSQFTFITDRRGRPIVDYIGRFEQLGEDFAVVCQRLALERYALQHLNPSKHRGFEEYFTDDVRRLVVRRFRRDFRTLGYEHRF